MSDKKVSQLPDVSSSVDANTTVYTVSPNGKATNAAMDNALGNMKVATYDPNNIGDDAFDMDNMVEGSDTKIMTASERSKLATVLPNDKGGFKDPAALRAAYPTGDEGWHAVVGSTDTVWVWDEGTSDWVDTTKQAGGDMTKAVYDPTAVEGDAFDMDNMAEGDNTKIFTDAERKKLEALLVDNSLPPVEVGDNGKTIQAYYEIPDEYGNAQDGDVNFPAQSWGGDSDYSRTYINTATNLIADALVNSQSIKVHSTAAQTIAPQTLALPAFAVGDQVMLHQTQCYRDMTKIFQYEFLEIKAISGNTVTFTTVLKNTYLSDATGDKVHNTMAQMVRVPQYDDVTIVDNTNAGPVATPWNGSHGGILVFRARTMSGGGRLRSNDAGFRSGYATALRTAVKACRNEGPLGRGGIFSSWSPEQTEYYEALESPVTGATYLGTCGGGSCNGLQAFDAGGGTFTQHILGDAYTYDGSAYDATALRSRLPMGRGRLRMNVSSGADSYSFEIADPLDTHWNGHSGAGIIICFIRDVSSWTGKVSGAGGVSASGGTALIYSPTPYSGGVDASGGTSSPRADDGIAVSTSASQTIKRGWRMTSTNDSTRHQMLVVDNPMSGTNRDIPTASWAQVPLITVASNNITGASLLSNRITLPKGIYSVSGWTQLWDAPGKVRLYDVTNSQELANVYGAGHQNSTNADVAIALPLSGIFELTAETVIEMQMYVPISGSGNAAGHALSIGDEMFRSLLIEQVS